MFSPLRKRGRFMQTSTGQRRQDFSAWLRTGRWPRRDGSRGLELKFNPWHDTDNGRFTFVGAGRYFGPGSAKSPTGRGQDVPKIEYTEDLALPFISSREEIDSWRAEQLAKHGDKPGYREAIEAQYRRYLDKLVPRSVDPASDIRAVGQAGDQSSPPKASPPEDGNARSPVRNELGGGRGSSGGQPGLPLDNNAASSLRGFRGGGGSFGGGGATGSLDWPTPEPNSTASTPSAEPPGGSASAPAVRRASIANEPRHTIVRNGYTYELGARGRMRRVSGVLSSTDTPMRSRTNQARAGGADRRTSDDGGHYIAARFNGPTDAFNHFAQDANFNRGRYRALEDQWARAQRMGKKVTVSIVPHYREESTRPFEIDASFTIDGREHSIKIPNERTEKTRAK